MSDATLMGDELLLLAKGVLPKTREWQTEIHLDRGGLPASRNKFLACNAAEAIYAQAKGDHRRVREILDWWVWFATTPFTAGEDLTGEEVYRSLMAYSHLAAAAVARVADHGPGYEAALALAKAHAAWLLLGAGCGPAKKVRDHHLGKVGKPVVLVGDGAPVSDLPYIAQAGKRGWIRSREKNAPPEFLFTESVGLSAIVGQAVGLNVPKKGIAWQADLFTTLRNYSPGLPPFGFTSVDQVVAQSFLRNPTDPTPVREIVKWLRSPDLPFTFVRYEDGSIVSLCERTGTSSTDARMIDAWYADGRSMKTSADDGLRSASPAQIGFELGDSYACQLASGGPVIAIPRPRVAEAWRVRTAEGRVTLTFPGIASQPPARPAPAGNQPPPPAPPPGDCGSKPKKPGWWRSSKVKRAYRAALAAWEACRERRS